MTTFPAAANLSVNHRASGDASVIAPCHLQQSILRAIEKYFGGTANYAKGKGSLFMDYMRRYHPTAYLYSISRACIIFAMYGLDE